MANLSNCTRCGKLYVKQFRDICRDCYLEEEKAYRKVLNFLKQRKNREATLDEVVKATGVEERIIRKFLKEKWLSPADYPKLGYPCERCGTLILTGSICFNCANELRTELKQIEEIEKVADRNVSNKQSKKSKNNLEDEIYFTIDKHRR